MLWLLGSGWTLKRHANKTETINTPEYKGIHLSNEVDSIFFFSMDKMSYLTSGIDGMASYRCQFPSL